MLAFSEGRHEAEPGVQVQRVDPCIRVLDADRTAVFPDSGVLAGHVHAAVGVVDADLEEPLSRSDPHGFDLAYLKVETTNPPQF